VTQRERERVCVCVPLSVPSQHTRAAFPAAPTQSLNAQRARMKKKEEKKSGVQDLPEEEWRACFEGRLGPGVALSLSLSVPFVTIQWKLERLGRHCRASAEGVHPHTLGLSPMPSGKRAHSMRACV